MTEARTTAASILAAATKALAASDNMPMAERCLRLYRDDARVVAIAVLRDLSRTKGKRPLDAASENRLSPSALLELADVLAETR